MPRPVSGHPLVVTSACECTFVVQNVVVPDWPLGASEEPLPASQPFDPGMFTVVVKGQDRFNSWELRDGHHPLLQDQAALGHEFVTTRLDGSGGGGNGGVSPALGPGQTAEVGTSAGGIGPDCCGYLLARCAESVRNVLLRYDDGSNEEFDVMLSSSTGEGWVVCPLDSTLVPTEMAFLGRDGALIEARAVADPRHRVNRRH